ncbi:hypothetical protein RND81_11G173600 [Saponaria officinalis]|uniref:NAD(P)-binding domain-containing protein n=1 Tax=Saponaria officinalis TaxID=3572 RepID=A0AAW1HN80_SAPOF
MDLICSVQLSSLAQMAIPTNKLPLRSAHFHRCRNHRFSCASPPHLLSCGVTRFSSATLETALEKDDSADEEVTVFVAGATGKVGSRTVRELLKMGFRVRAGVRNAQRAETLIQSVRDMNFDSTGVQPIEKLEIVECDLEKPDQILPALAYASVVICCIGASEKEIFDITGPFRIDYQATKNLIDAARAAKVNHFILLTSLGTNKIGFPAAILNLFWGVLCWKRKAEEELIASGLPYTIVRPGGMERPTDRYKETHNITLSQQDTLFGGQVSNLQVAELMAVMAQNPDLSHCKIVEVVAETTAPLIPMEDLLAKIPSNREDIPKAKQLDVVPKLLDPEPVNKAEADVASEEGIQVGYVAAKPNPLSPYTAYDDLKPPSSPTPTAPNGQIKEIAATDTMSETPDSATSVPGTEVIAEITETGAVRLQKPQSLSPYVAYEDLKPPSSPSPSSPGNGNYLNESVTTPKVVDGVPNVIDGTLAGNDPRESTFYHSPFPVYDDLRPPTSPTPTAPNSYANVVSFTDSEAADTTSTSTDNGLEPGISSVDGIEPVTAQSTSVDEQNPPVPKSRPLSPYTMYDDMKPPSSPMPSPKIH